GSLKSWAEYSADECLKQSIFSLKQDTKLLGDFILKKGAQALRASFDKNNLNPDDMDYVLAHISSNYFKDGLREEFEAVGRDFPNEKWFDSLSDVRSVGAAPIYIP